MSNLVPRYFNYEIQVARIIGNLILRFQDFVTMLNVPKIHHFLGAITGMGFASLLVLYLGPVAFSLSQIASFEILSISSFLILKPHLRNLDRKSVV